MQSVNIMEEHQDKRPISLSLIIQKNLSNSDEDMIEQQLLKLKRIWLDRLEITNIDNLEMLGKVTHLYLDYNSISLIQNLETLGTTLRHLSLKRNKITAIGEGLICLEQLISLDLGENEISEVLVEALPSKLSFLNLLDNPVLTSENYREESFLKGLPRLKVYNNSVLCEEIEDVEQDDDEADGDEEEAEIECFQDLTRNLRETSKARQIIIDENHRNKISTLTIMKEELITAAKAEPVTSNAVESLIEREGALRPVVSREKNTLPPLERHGSGADRCGSSQSFSRVLLDPIPPKKSSHNKQLATPNQRQNTPPRSAKRMASVNQEKTSEVDMSLRQPLETALIKVEDFDNYVTEVNKKFSDLRSSFGGL